MNQNYIHDEIKSRLISGNPCYHSIQNILSLHLQSQHVNSKIIILPVRYVGVNLVCYIKGRTNSFLSEQGAKENIQT
jgi:hypothetical protein